LPKRVWLPLIFNSYLTVDGRPAQLVKYYLVGGQRIASRAGSVGAVTYYYHDQLGSTVASSGGESTRYWPYGATRSGGVGTAYQFTGQRREAALGLYFYQARWYDGQVGRFLQADTIVPAPGDPQSLNRYSYTRNNPVRYVDPDGHWPNIPSVNGSLGVTGLSSTDTMTLQHPAVQPLTLSVPNDRPMVSAGVAPRPDDGLLLQYYNPGYANRREELAATTPAMPLPGGVGSVQAQVRQVTIYSSLLGSSVKDAYVENALSGGVGVYKFVEVGAEYASGAGRSGAGVAPYVAAGPLQLQPGQIMLNFASPIGGPGGGIGAQYQMPGNAMFLTSQARFDKVGGERGFTELYASGYTLLATERKTGYWYNGRWVSGVDAWRDWLYRNGIERYEER
jgi:RHS repeat-associated protein